MDIIVLTACIHHPCTDSSKKSVQAANVIKLLFTSSLGMNEYCIDLTESNHFAGLSVIITGTYHLYQYSVVAVWTGMCVCKE